MQTLLFEMKPRTGHEEHYFAHVAALRPMLMKQQGMLFIQRYKSLNRSGFILSHSLWQDEASISQWRANKAHQRSQTAGRYRHFEDYRIRISEAFYCHAKHDDTERSGIGGCHTPSRDTADRFVTIIRGTKVPKFDCLETYESVTEPESFLSVTEFCSQELGYGQCLAAQSDNTTISAILASVSRDYGMHDRAEAPQP